MLEKFRKFYKPIVWVMIVVFGFSILISVVPLFSVR
jgi:hypothetical protein